LQPDILAQVLGPPSLAVMALGIRLTFYPCFPLVEGKSHMMAFFLGNNQSIKTTVAMKTKTSTTRPLLSIEQAPSGHDHGAYSSVKKEKNE